MNRPDRPKGPAEPEHGERPRAKTMVQLDLYNAYARLGVSPLLQTDEIKEIINRKRKEVMRLRRTRGEQVFGEEESEMTRLQAIEDEIGTPKARERYDWLNPQNALLTVQPGPADTRLDPKHRAGLATAWLLEKLGREAALSSPESLALRAPKGLDPDLVEFLSQFAAAAGGEPRSNDRGQTDLPEVADLSRQGASPASGNGCLEADAIGPAEASREKATGGSENG